MTNNQPTIYNEVLIAAIHEYHLNCNYTEHVMKRRKQTKRVMLNITKTTLPK